jgi:hypothetical protein
MDDLLPYYERELGFLRRYSREFSEKYPKIAGDLLMAGEVCEDPHIERMIQSLPRHCWRFCTPTTCVLFHRALLPDLTIQPTLHN